MRVQITARHCEVSAEDRERAEELISALHKYEPRIAAADVVFEVENRDHKVEAIVSVERREPAVCTGTGPTFRAAVDQLVDRLGKILRRRHARIVDHKAPRPEPLVELERAAE